ncbi:hypothetical protein [Massilia sp. METH4]|uniref:hypothetical protein n=1 Tax=Massilia sp. METH4 TaxID=3123041 RepID=UPI0030CB32D7
MTDIYQQIWDADQQHAGLKAVHKGESIDAFRETGHVVVNELEEASRTHKLIEEVHIPAHKQQSYDLVNALLNNYTLDQTKAEVNFPEEQDEVQRFLDYAHKTPPMEVARAYVNERLDQPLSTDQWWAVLQRVWFEQYSDGKNRDLSGFEHVVVGEQRQAKVQGYHSWYKYYLDEHFQLNGVDRDSIEFLDWRNSEEDTTPDVATLSFVWEAFDYQRKEFRKLTKPIGGFWIGPSVEGLLALGTVRFMAEVLAPRHAVINGFKYNLPLFRSANNRHLRTFYPEFSARV